MPTVHMLTLGPLQTNTYIVYHPSSPTCAIIDPAFDAQAILEHVAGLGLTVDAILLTHGHFDHVGAVEEIVRATNCRLWMHETDYDQKKNPITERLYPIAGHRFPHLSFCQEGTGIPAGGLTFTTLATPGHTYGSVCYLCENVLFTGDTLFSGGCGRIDLPGGNRKAILDSLHRLGELKGDYAVCPGHGESTTLAEEKQYNPYMR